MKKVLLFIFFIFFGTNSVFAGTYCEWQQDVFMADGLTQGDCNSICSGDSHRKNCEFTAWPNGVNDCAYDKWVCRQTPELKVVPGALYRYWSPKKHDHFYTTNANELGGGNNDYMYNGHAGYVETTQKSGTVPLYRYCHTSKHDHFYTTNWGELGNGRSSYKYEGVQCYVYDHQVNGTAPFYRYYQTNTKDHFYTKNWNELGNGKSGYVYEGIACYIKNKP